MRWFVLFLSMSLMACAAEEVDSSDSENQGTDQSVTDDTQDPSDASTTDDSDTSDSADASDETDATDETDSSDASETDSSDESSATDPADATDTPDEEVDLTQLDLNGTLPAANLEPPEFVALNRDGTERTEADLVGQPTVMWFFPLANSPG